MTGMLASVETMAEALLVLAAGADIIDLKLPSSGALGALPTETVREIVRAVGGLRPVSATIGDLPMVPQPVRQAVESMAGAGVDYVKIGLFPGGDWQRTIVGLSPVASRGVRLVAVLFGDQRPGLSHIAELAKAGFSAAMLDTLDKRGGSLPCVCPPDYLRDFVAEAKAYGMLCGLAGSLRPSDIPKLLDLRPDYLGFRGALCLQQERTAGLDENAVRVIRRLLP
jgi:uncharacterized protein (UPF0264 family)